MQTWHWRTWSGLPYLTCSILDPWSHGFFTRQFSPRSPEELTQVLQSAASVYRLKQVHGNIVLSPSEVRSQETRGQGDKEDLGTGGQGELGARGARGRGAEGENQIRLEKFCGTETDTATPVASTEGTSAQHWLNFSQNPKSKIQNSLVTALAEADGLITEEPEQAVWVASADCTPVLLADSKTGQVAAIHAGWRGTALKIVPQAIARLLAQGSQIQDLRIALGPAIAGEVYQVSTMVASQVGASIFPREAESILDSLQQLPDSPVLPDPHLERVRLDIRRVIALQLEQLGVSPEQLAIAPYCTYQEPEYFFSYRRDQLKKVQWSGIVSTSN